MSKKRKRYLTAIIILIIIMSLSKPSPETFNKWLASKYDRECVGDECVHGNSKEIVVRRDIDNYILINKMGVILEDEEERRTLIVGIGVFGTFIPFAYNPVYSPFVNLYKY